MKKVIISAISILLGCLILGISFYKSQENKQVFLEKQQQLEFRERQFELERKYELQSKIIQEVEYYKNLDR
jgi:hypothetical protein